MTNQKLHAIQRKNRITVAKYLALHAEYADKSKCLITFVSADETYTSLLKIRKIFLAKVVSILKRKQFEKCIFKYFATVEFGSDPLEKKFNLHLHIQVFYDDITPIKQAYEYVLDRLHSEISNSDFTEAKNHKKKFTYIIKNYFPSKFDATIQQIKEDIYRGKAMYWCSRKTLPDYVIRHLYNELSKRQDWNQHKDRYQLILDLMDKGHLIIRPIKDIEDRAMYKIIKQWGYVLKS